MPFFSFCYLTALSVSRLRSVGDGIINEYVAVYGTIIGRGNRSTQRNSAPVPLCPTSPDVESNPDHSGGKRRLTAWAMTRSHDSSICYHFHLRSGLPAPLVQLIQRIDLLGLSGRSVKLLTHLHMMYWSEMDGCLSQHHLVGLTLCACNLLLS
jgi:hypothetical protein